MSEQSGRIAHRTCPLCEATCGLEITVGAGEQIVRIRGDREDVFSHGFICPKGSTLKQLHDDPDRLRAPLVKRDGVHVEVSWEDAWQAVHDGLAGVIARHGRGSLAAYVGNPNAHNLGASTFLSVLLRSLGSRNIFSASSVDQMPKHVAGGFMFGTAQSIPVPDLDRTEYLLMLGANPFASNGSLCTAPDFPGRIAAIRDRGGKVVTVDPRRTKTADASDEWVPIRPGTDGFFLAAIAHVLFDENLVSLEPRIAALVNGLDELREAVVAFTPELAESATTVPAEATRRIARELAAAPSAAVYGRIGVNTVEFGTLNAWLIDVINVLTGNIDRPGGAMFTLPAAGSATTRGPPGKGNGFATRRGHSRVSKRPEVLGEYPTAVMAEEILEPGEGQVRAMITVAGNPVVSTQNSARLDDALADLEFMVSVDIYLNETTRHADVILPPPSALEKDHYDVSLYTFAVRNVANYSPPVLARAEGQPDEWEILARLAGIAQGLGPEVDPASIDEATIGAMVAGAIGSGGSAIAGRDADEILDALSRDGRRGPARVLDFLLQNGPYGAAFGANPAGLSLDVLLDNPHGVDLGALEPRLPEALRTPSGKIELSPQVFLDEAARLLRGAASIDESQMLLVGRRELKSNNSWMHNMKVLTKGSLACTAQLSPDDAARLGISSGDTVRIESRVGAIEIEAEVTDALSPGVVSVPHGWGHSVAGTRMSVAAEKPGVNSNILTDDAVVDPLSGNGVLSAIPVTVTLVSA
ncbi:MAG: molybdopterin-dependent oxidoreductase [Ilumatobacteraceae bacterium]